MPSKTEARPKRLTVRMRLALTYALLVTLMGVVLTAFIAVYFGLVPNYSFEAAMSTTPAESIPSNSDLMIEMYPLPGQASLLVPSDIAVTIGSRDDMLRQLFLVSGGTLVVLAALGAWIGWIIAGRMLRPLQEVNAAARRAAEGHLDHRVALVGPRDEISDLADTFDEMLGEIEQSVDAHRRFAANASHELRTPLATNKVMLDVALGAADVGERELLERLRETNERSIATVESLLDLAEIEAIAGVREPVDLGAVIQDVLDECADEARAAGVVTTFGFVSQTVDADPVLVRQLVTNLVQNAMRHNEPGGHIAVATTEREGLAGVQVSNSGEMMSPDEAQQLTEPFRRGKGRTSGAAARGRGLGLSIVQAIVEAHRGVLEVVANPSGGLTVTVLLPRAD